MRKFFITLFVLLILGCIAAIGGLYYIKPDQQLDLSYNRVPIDKRAVDMVSRMSVAMILNEEDVNNLLKASLSRNPQVQQDVKVIGAKFSVDGNLLTSDLNVLWKDQIQAALQLTYRLQWENPNVVATIVDAQMKAIPLPTEAFSDLVIPLGEELPELLKIKDIEWGGKEIKVVFEKPNLQDIKDLLG
ncbi:hypothetical protein SD71_02490 [Cohnella kolymensis]|uniref:DUF2140 family protein n=1 Tax=Cohnella kolymensis TaxID=1590652 RepID=A0ABR5A965_9BACL|nr:hypothetical protein [Cohnella kolymensis]KIL37520.1 hypothetical protein SD71_02490 [Cohnella kolymensis]